MQILFFNIINTLIALIFAIFENQSLEFYIFTFHDIIKCLSIKQIHILLNNFGSKHNVLIKFGQFMSYYKIKDFMEKFYKNYGLKTSYRPVWVCKELSTTSVGKFVKQATYIRYVMAKLSKFLQISMQTSDFFLQMILWKMKKGLGLVSGIIFHRICW